MARKYDAQRISRLFQTMTTPDPTEKRKTLAGGLVEYCYSIVYRRPPIHEKISLTEDCLPKGLMSDDTKTATIGPAAILQLGCQCNCWPVKYQLWGTVLGGEGTTQKLACSLLMGMPGVAGGLSKSGFISYSQNRFTLMIAVERSLL